MRIFSFKGGKKDMQKLVLFCIITFFIGVSIGTTISENNYELMSSELLVENELDQFNYDNDDFGYMMYYYSEEDFSWLAQSFIPTMPTLTRVNLPVWQGFSNMTCDLIVSIREDINGSDLVEEPFNTTFSPFTRLFENLIGDGMVFFIIPLMFIAGALYYKTKDPAIVSMFMIVSGGLFAGGSIFVGMIHVSVVFIIFAALGLGGLVISILLDR